MKILTSHRSPNYASREGQAVSLLVLHYTDMPTMEAARNILCDPAAKVSSHYLVDEDGAIYQLVEEQNIAWHAGISGWRGFKNVNPISIGIEIANPGHRCGYRAFPPLQMQAVAELCRDIIARHRIEPRNVVGHSDIAPDRKKDPGELFDWPMLAKSGVGLWPEVSESDIATTLALRREWRLPDILAQSDNHNGVHLLREDLAKYGYSIESSDIFDELTTKVVTAFQRHFRPRSLTGKWDAHCATLLAALLKMV